MQFGGWQLVLARSRDAVPLNAAEHLDSPAAHLGQAYS
jgi:hypothetical protein